MNKQPVRYALDSFQGGSALDAAERAVNALEDNNAFNAGHGSVLTETGTVEMDSIIVDGTNRRTGNNNLIIFSLNSRSYSKTSYFKLRCSVDITFYH